MKTQTATAVKPAPNPVKPAPKAAPPAKKPATVDKAFDASFDGPRSATLNLNTIRCVRNRELTDDDIESMAKSIGNINLINPLTLRRLPEPDSNGRVFEVLAGRCRYFALMLLKRYELPPDDYRIVNTTDPELISFVENFERRNLKITEEIEHLAALAKTHDYADIAAMIGRTEKYVRLRLNLNKLTNYFKKSLVDDSHPTLKVGHYEIISRYPENVQAQLEGQHWRLDSPGSVEKFATDLDGIFCRLLTAAPFDVAACATCPKRSLAEPWLFEELKNKKDDRCLDSACWEKKKAAKIAADLEAIKKGKSNIVPDGKPVHVISTDYDSGDVPKGVKPLTPDKYEIIKDKSAAPNAYVCHGPGAGTYCHVRLRDNPEPVKADAPKTVEDKHEQLQKRREKRAIELLAEFIHGNDAIPEPLPVKLLFYAAHLGLHSLADGYHPGSPLKGGLDNLAENLQAPLPEVSSRVWKQLRDVLAERLLGHANNILPNIRPGVGSAVCKALELDWKSYLDKATEEIPEPKSWKAEK